MLILRVFLKLFHNQSKTAPGSRFVCSLPPSPHGAAVPQLSLRQAAPLGWPVWKPSCRLSCAEPHLDSTKMVFPDSSEHLHLILLAKGVQLLKCLLICSLKWSDKGSQTGKKNALSFVPLCCRGAWIRDKCASVLTRSAASVSGVATVTFLARSLSFRSFEGLFVLLLAHVGLITSAFSSNKIFLDK